MRYKKRLNNNVVVAISEDGQEQILTGKGLGFQMQQGAIIEESRIEKIFTLKDEAANQRLQELLKTIPPKHVEVAEEIINFAHVHITNKINESVIVALCDHIYMAVERKKQGIEVRNVMLWDIRKFYPDEFKVGEVAVTLIHQYFDVQLNEDEAGFIALHLVNAQLDVQSKTVNEITQVMQEIETIVRMSFSITPDTSSVYYYRFITHLKFFAQRLFSQKTYEGQDVSNMFDIVKQRNAQEVACAEKIAGFIETKYHYTLSAEELLYLSIHISRIVQVSSAEIA